MLEMKSISLCFLGILAGLFGVVHAGNFIGRVTVRYNVYGVLEGERFEMTCIATHEDRRPQLQWYFMDQSFKRTNLTDLQTNGVGFTARKTFSKSSAKLSDSGDYYCLARVGNDDDEQATSRGIPVLVIKPEKKPRVNISKTTDARGDTSLLTCKAYPQGRGYFTWLKEGRRIKYNTQATNKLELVSPANGKYQCRGNLTLGSFKYFISNAYVTAAAGWSSTATQTSFLSFISICFIAVLNL